MVAQILCISISGEPDDFLISYSSRGCSLKFNAFPRFLFGCFQFQEAPHLLGYLFFPSGLRRITYDFQTSKILKEIAWSNIISKAVLLHFMWVTKIDAFK